MNVVKTAEFDRWLKDLRDSKARAKILIRIDRLSLGNAGDAEPVGEGVSEMRIHYGPGYRIYFMRQGDQATLLWGGYKDTQASDIKRAKQLLQELKE